MADSKGADAYFGETTRKAEWAAFDDAARTAAVQEAAGMMGCLSFLRRPPQQALDKATYEQALCLLSMQNHAGKEAARARASGIKSRNVLDASESYATAAELESGPGWIGGLYYCPRALMWLRGYVAENGAIKTGRMVMDDGY